MGMTNRLNVERKSLLLSHKDDPFGEVVHCKKPNYTNGPKLSKSKFMRSVIQKYKKLDETKVPITPITEIAETEEKVAVNHFKNKSISLGTEYLKCENAIYS
jgi:hypothetical protein